LDHQPVGGPQHGVEHGWIPRIDAPEHADPSAFAYAVPDTDADTERDVMASGDVGACGLMAG